MKMDDIDKKIHLTCDCGAHIMQVNCFLEHKSKDMYHQEWNFAMFNYSGLGKPSFIDRVKTAWNYLRNGEMHKDQIVLDENEANALARFINQNNWGKCIDKTKSREK